MITRLEKSGNWQHQTPRKSAWLRAFFMLNSGVCVDEHLHLPSEHGLKAGLDGSAKT